MVNGKASEMVSQAHPDMVADFISDSLVDACMEENKHVRTGIETLVTPDHVTLGGEIGGVVLSQSKIDEVVRSAVRDLGYTRPEFGFSADTLEITSHLHQQSADIAMGVVDFDRIKGAGDIGIMFGYACRETKALITAPLFITRELMRVHNASDLSYFGMRPDAKCQYAAAGKDKTLVMCVSHDEEADVIGYVDHLVEWFRDEHPEMASYLEDCVILTNPTGKFVICGPYGDSGLTGRKIVATQYGGACPVGGGAFSGKDCSKVDRSAAYMARYLATEVLLNKTPNEFSDKEVLIGLSYAIGVEQPTSIEIRSNFLSKSEADECVRTIQSNYDLSPQGICDFLSLKNIKYAPTARNGHFGVSAFHDDEFLRNFTWERLALENQRS